MKLVALLLRYTELPVRKLLGLAFAAGLSSALVLMTINSATAVEVTEYRRIQLFLMFCTALTAYILSHHFVLSRTTAEVEKTLHRLRCQLADRLRVCELRSLEQIERADLIAAANKDCYAISQAAYPLVNAAQSLLLILVTCVYVAFISLTALIAGILLTALCVPIHLAQLRSLQAAMKKSTKIETGLFTTQADLLDGAKELRLHQPRSQALGESFESSSAEAAELKTEQRIRFASLFVFSQVGYYLLLATMVFMAPQLADAEQKTVIGTAMAVLFILGPISTVIGGIPIFANANAAAESLEETDAKLADAEEKLEVLESPTLELEELSLRDIEFDYEAQDFSLGPISLDLKPGNLVFFTGGNGSGKSTLAKLICGLYQPASGKILVDQKRVKAKKNLAYRSLFSSVLADFHLFQTLHGIDADDDEMDDLLEEFGLAGKTVFEDGSFSTLNLSTGQRKRLALVVAILEKRPCLVLDEWAAEQDPDFRNYFYTTLLPRFKEQGKLVIVVTHDDRYFHLADQLVRLEHGTIQEAADLG